MDEGGSRDGASLSEEAHCGGPQGRAPLLGTLGVLKESLGTCISLHGGSVGQHVGLSTRDFERWLKGALEMGHLSMGALRREPEGGLPCWGPWKISRKGSGVGHLLP